MNLPDYDFNKIKFATDKQTFEKAMDLLLRLDKKLISGGVDDSDGTV